MTINPSTWCIVYLFKDVIWPCNEGCKSAPWTALWSPERAASVPGDGGEQQQLTFLLTCIMLMTKQSYSVVCTAILGFKKAVIQREIVKRMSKEEDELETNFIL